MYEEKEAMCRECGHKHMVAVIYDEDGEMAAIEITRCGDCGALNPVEEEGEPEGAAT